MLTKIIKDYFSFTRKERVGVIVLTFLIIAIMLLPKIFPQGSESLSIGIGKQLMDSLKAPVGNSYEADQRGVSTGNRSYGSRTSRSNEYEKPAKHEMFSFDPNNLSVADWKRLGIRDRTIATINNYLARGGQFRIKEDIAKIYGLSPPDIERLMPFVVIDKHDNPVDAKRQSYKRERFESTYPAFKPAERKPLERRAIDINTADSADFESLPGIGQKLASRIINFRQKLGGFHDVSQLQEIYGLQDSVFRKIEPMLVNNHVQLAPLDINKATVDELKLHPYIKWAVANAMVKYRQQHGPFQSIEDLKKLDLVTEDIFNKIKPYLQVE